jgi:hypothetical protein
MNNRKKTSLANRVLLLADKARVLYQKKDHAFEELIKACAIGEVIETRIGRFEIIDNFAARNVSFRPASFHRYELKEVRMPKAEKKPTTAKPEPVSEPQETTPAKEEVALVQSNPG